MLFSQPGSYDAIHVMLSWHLESSQSLRWLQVQRVLSLSVQELLLSYNIGIDPTERQRSMIVRTANRVGLRMPIVPSWSDTHRGE